MSVIVVAHEFFLHEPDGVVTLAQLLHLMNRLILRDQELLFYATLADTWLVHDDVVSDQDVGLIGDDHYVALILPIVLRSVDDFEAKDDLLLLRLQIKRLLRSFDTISGHVMTASFVCRGLALRCLPTMLSKSLS